MRANAAYLKWLQALGAQVAAYGHKLVICSPYPGSADPEVLQGAAGAQLKVVEVHYPSTPEIRVQVSSAVEGLGLVLKGFVQPYMDGADPRSISYSWLLAQLAALDASDVVVAAGGRLGGSAGLKLPADLKLARPDLHTSE